LFFGGLDDYTGYVDCSSPYFRKRQIDFVNDSPAESILPLSWRCIACLAEVRQGQVDKPLVDFCCFDIPVFVLRRPEERNDPESIRRHESSGLLYRRTFAMDAVLNLVGIAGAIGIVLGLFGLILLAVIAARLSRVNDLLDEIAELITKTGRQQEFKVGQPQ